MKGILIFEDVAGKKVPITLNGLPSTDAGIMTKMQALALSIESYCNAVVLEYGIIRPIIQDNPAFAGAVDTGVEYLSSMHKGLVSFNYIEDNETKPVMLYIPAPNLAQYEHVDEVGYRMTTDYGTALRDALRTATGKTGLQFNEGITEFREGRSARPSDGAFIAFEDFYLRRQYMGVPGVADIADLATFANYMITAPKSTLCDWRFCGIMTPDIVRRDVDPVVESGWDSVNIRAQLKFSWVESAKRQSMQMTIPAPKSSIFVNPQSAVKKRYVKQASGDGVALALTALYGSSVRNLNFELGVCDVKNIYR